MDSVQQLHRDKSKVSVLSRLLPREYKWPAENEAKEQHLNSQLFFCSAPCVTIGSNEKANIWGRWSSKQAGSERRCPRVHIGQPIYTLSFLFSPHFHSLPSLLFKSLALPPFWSLAEFRTGLPLPGRLGWWSPRPQGLGRPPGRLLEETICKKTSVKYWR